MAFPLPCCYTHHMGYRTIKIDWLPSSGKQWKTFTAARMEAGRLWSWVVERHADARQQGGIWPTKAELQHEIKRQFPNLHSQSAQQTVADFCAPLPRLSRFASMGKSTHTPIRNRSTARSFSPIRGRGFVMGGWCCHAAWLGACLYVFLKVSRCLVD